MTTLGIDIETYSGYDLKKSGVHKYVEHPDFKILMLSFCFDDSPVITIDLIGDDICGPEELPKIFIDALTDSGILKTAHNANFEITCLNKYLNITLDPSQWQCTMIKGAMLGLPMSLSQAGKALNLVEQKSAGTLLINYFSKRGKQPSDNIGKWLDYLSYNAQDVNSERSIRTHTNFYKFNPAEQKLWELDQQINKKGILIDQDFIRKAISFDLTTRERLIKEAIEITGVANPNSTAQLKFWIESKLEYKIASLTKANIALLVEKVDDPKIKRVLEIRLEISKSSIRKYTAMLDSVCSDGRCRGLLQFYGASRTGRWAGRLIQVHNLPRNKFHDLDLARKLVKAGELEILQMMFGSISEVLSQLIRTAFIAKKGHKLIISDFSAIEARVIAWLAGEKWRMEVFKTHGRIYEASAAKMFKMPIEKIINLETGEVLDAATRYKGKVAELSLGYQGGPDALIRMGALDMGLTEDELPPIVIAWRKENSFIVALWYAVQRAAVSAVDQPGTVAVCKGIYFQVRHNVLFVKLPSGRELSYIRPVLYQSRYGANIKYEGINQVTRQWQHDATYGGKLVENIIQAIARDLLAEKIKLINKAFPDSIVMHVHDEIVLEVLLDVPVEKVNKIMSLSVSWANGLPIDAVSFESPYYKKD